MFKKGPVFNIGKAFVFTIISVFLFWCGKNGKTVPRKTEEIDHLKTLQIAPPVGA